MATVSKNNYQSGGNQRLGGVLVPCKVREVILDPNSELAKSLGGHDAIGGIYYNKIRKRVGGMGTNPDAKDKEKKDRYDGFALPLFPFLKYFPLKNEIVPIITLTSKDYLEKRTSVIDYYLPPLNLWNHPHHNSLPAVQNYQPGSDNEGNADGKLRPSEDYEHDGLERRPVSGTINLNIPLGNYFTEKLNLKPLLPYEGDHITEGRWGNSIRLGSTARGVEKDEELGREKYEMPTGSYDLRNPWSRGGVSKNGDPITIIRNGQPPELDTIPEQYLGGELYNDYSGSAGWIHTVEDVNLDPSSIYLTSTQNLKNLQVAAPGCWYSFGLNAAMKQDSNKEANKFVEDPSQFLYDEEQEVETTETPTGGPEGTEGGAGGGGGTKPTPDDKVEVYKDKRGTYRYTKMPDGTYWYKVGEDGEWIQQTRQGGIDAIEERLNSPDLIERLDDVPITDVNPDFTFPEPPTITPQSSGIISEDAAGFNENESIDNNQYYEGGTQVIDPNLPSSYMFSNGGAVPVLLAAGLLIQGTQGQSGTTGALGKARCEGCIFFNRGSGTNSNRCNKWNAEVRSDWYCQSFVSKD